MIWNTISSVFGRAAPASLGLATIKVFDPKSSEHCGRNTFDYATGNTMVSGYWSPIVAKVRGNILHGLEDQASTLIFFSQGDVLDNDTICRAPYHRVYASATPNLTYFTSKLISYSGDDQPNWATSKQGSYIHFINRLSTRGTEPHIQVVCCINFVMFAQLLQI